MKLSTSTKIVHYHKMPYASSTQFDCTTTKQEMGFNKHVNLNIKKTKLKSDMNLRFNKHSRPTSSSSVQLGKRWMEYQGIGDWNGLLDPLDDNLRSEIIRYGHFVEAAYKGFDFNTSSPSYATCRYPKNALLNECGLEESGYKMTKNLRATSSIELPRWTNLKVPQSSWIGYVAVCQNKAEIARLGRRDVVIAYRGTATCLEWLENLRATLTHFPGSANEPTCHCGPMVETGFSSLYTSKARTGPSLQDMVRDEIWRNLQTYVEEALSLTIVGHSLGAALAILTAYDIRKTFGKRAPMVTAISFGGPRVGNPSFRCCLKKQGIKILRIVNPSDLITKVPGFVIDEAEDDDGENKVGYGGWANFSEWIRKRVDMQSWLYAELGQELRVCSQDSPSYMINPIDMATCHDLRTYLNLLNGFGSS
ncbi:Fungal lipase-like domain [Dillenia turbinata]|uniref:Fungal lipase-like domain n=1 Tax=Dillenia turbinata TaxID=194707 RepID=A0AAN8Z076_9MAGN